MVQRILTNYEGIAYHRIPTREPKHGFEHIIETTGLPVCSPCRCLDPARLSVAHSYFEQMEAAGICERRDLPWALPLHIVVKSDKSLRPCSDFRLLNIITTPSTYAVPNIKDFTGQLSGSHFFSIIDLSKAYWQVPVSLSSIPKTATVTPFGMFLFKRMPFRLRNAGSTFQRLIDSVLSGVKNVFCYMDDIMLHSRSIEEHEKTVREVLQRLREAGLVFNPAKSVIFPSSIDFLGHNVSESSISSLSRNTMKLSSFSTPKDKTSLKCFLGLRNYYRRFLPGLATLVKPLTDLTSPKLPFSWTPACDSTFRLTKNALNNATSLAFPIDSTPLGLAPTPATLASALSSSSLWRAAGGP